MSRHTPGPWRPGRIPTTVVSEVLAEGAVRGSDATDYYGGHLIAESMAPENVSLVAAAPEMYEVLDTTNCYKCHVPIGYPDERPSDCPYCANARAAIAKARGGQA